MLNPNFLMLYVNNPTISVQFYSALLQKKPCESSPSFAMFLLEHGYKLGLWARHTVEPAAVMKESSCELGFPVTQNIEVDSLFAAWKTAGIPIAQPPTHMDFGYTFVALDPDEHRLRVYALRDWEKMNDK